MVRRLRRVWIVPVLAVLLVAVVVAPVRAQEKTLRWRRWDVLIRVNEDGTFRVVETHEIQFTSGEFTFGFRNIPLDQIEEITDEVVREGDITYTESYGEAPHTFYVSFDGGDEIINWFYPPTSGATRVFAVEYTVHGGLLIDVDETGEGDQLFWKAVASDHAFPVESSMVTVELPAEATVYQAYGTDADVSLTNDNRTVTFVATEAIQPGDEFEVRVQFPHGVVQATMPPWQAEWEQERAWDEQQRPLLNVLFGGAGVLLLFGGPAGVYLLWVMRGRDPKVGVVPEFLSEPPSDLEPGLAGTLIDEKADMQDIIATLVDLARRGVIQMEEGRETGLFGLSTSSEFTFRRLETSERLRPYEDTLLKRMFGKRSEVDLSDLQYKFHTAVPVIQRELYEEAVKEGFFRASPKVVRGRYTAVGIVGLVLSFAVGCCVLTAVSSAGTVDSVLCPFVSLGLTSIVMIFVGQAMPAKTREGAEEAAKWKAFKTYLTNVERYADLAEVSGQFDKYLPYAVAFGLERGWVRKFSRVEAMPMPGWYIPFGTRPHLTGGGVRDAKQASQPGGRDLRKEAARPAPSLDRMSEGAFSGLGSISDGLFSMLSSTASTFTSVPRSSSSGGFSGGGGGFSGGGFSGGGGGGGGGAGFG